MKTRVLTLLFIFILMHTTISTLAQIQNCTPPSAAANLDINNVRALIQNGGDMWWDLVGQARYEVPKNSGRTAFFTHSLWIGGQITNTNILGLAAIRYRQSGVDYFPGPLDSNGVTIDTTCQKYNRIFTIYRNEIQQHIAGFQTTQSVMEWPGRGNPVGHIPLQDLAPFVDVNGDGIYNALDGDYPDIKGDQALWYVFNDYGNVHTESGGAYIGIEVQVMTYAYATNNALNNTTFYDYKIINKNRSMTNTYMGLFTDVDLGNPFDDAIGCDTSRDMGIGYNGDPLDEDYGGGLGYGVNPPVVGIRTVLNPKKQSGPRMRMSGFMYFNNDMSQIGTPQTPIEHYGSLQNKWRDGSHLVQGGTGHFSDPIADPNVPVNYIFPGIPSNTNTWSSCSAGISPGDRRFLMNYGPFDFAKGDELTYTVAVLFTRDVNAPSSCNENFNLIKQTSDEVKLFADTAMDCSLFNPLYQAQVTDASPGLTNGSIDLAFMGGTPKVLWSTGDTTLSIAGLDTGNYTAVLSNGFNCYKVLHFYVDVVSSVPEIFASSNLKMYPNPAKEQLIVSHDLTGQTTGAILDLSGREIKSFELNSTGTVVETGNITNGTYLVRIENSGKVAYLKLLIMK